MFSDLSVMIIQALLGYNSGLIKSHKEVMGCLKLFKRFCLVLFLLLLMCVPVYGGEPSAAENSGIAHIQSVEITSSPIMDVETTDEYLNKQLDIAKKVGVIFLLFVVIGVLVIYREPNLYGLHSVVSLKKKDRKAVTGQVRCSKKIPCTEKEIEVLSLMYGLVKNINLLLMSGILDLTNSGVYCFDHAEDGSLCLIKKLDIKVDKKTLKSTLALADLLGSGVKVSDLSGLCDTNEEKVLTFLEAYAKEGLTSLFLANKFKFFRFKIHKVDVYRTNNSTRTIIKDIRGLLAYMDVYGIESLEGSTREEDIGRYGRLINFFGLDMEAISSEELRKTLMYSGMLKEQVLSLNKRVVA